MEKASKIYVAGHRGLVGSAIVKTLQTKGYNNLIFRTRAELDLTNQQDVASFFEQERPDYVILAAAKVGGIVANNTYRAQFMFENLQIQNNVIHQSYVCGVKKLLFLGSTCIYPKNSPQPMLEDSLLTGELEYTNEPYAIAKIAGLKMCESYNLQYDTNFISVMPTNLYGPNDNFDLETSHVLPALIRKFHLAKLLSEERYDEVVKDLNLSSIEEAINYLEKFGVSKTSVEIWGSGKPRREFLYSEDMADACVFALEKVNFKDLIADKKEIRNTHINIGTGKDISISELGSLIKEIIAYEGDIKFNINKPDGTLVKLTNPQKIRDLGWSPKTSLEQGILAMYKDYIRNFLIL